MPPLTVQILEFSKLVKRKCGFVCGGVLHALSFQQDEGVNQEREKGRGTKTGDPTGEKSEGNPRMMILKGYWRMTTVYHAQKTTSPDLSRTEGLGDSSSGRWNL